MSEPSRIGDIVAIEGPLAGEVTFEWKIKDFFSLSDEIDRSYTSPYFGFSNMCLFLELFPNGQSKHQSSGWLGLYICRVDAGPTKTFLYRYGIKSTNGLKYEIKEDFNFIPQQWGCGHSKFCSRSTLKDQSSTIMPRNVLTINAVLTSIVPGVTKDEDEFLNSMQNLLKSAEAADFTINVQGKEYPVHRAILGARSGVFKSMFTLDMIEKNKGVVTIADCDPEVFSDFLEYIYTGSTDISAENVIGLYTLSDKYDVSLLKEECSEFMIADCDPEVFRDFLEHIYTGSTDISAKNVVGLYTLSDKSDVSLLKEECSEFMKRTLTVSNFCDVIKLALKHDDKELLKSATEFFGINSLAIVKTADWQTFLDENPTVGNELFIKVLLENERISSEMVKRPLKKRKRKPVSKKRKRETS